jgi:hypothetical protein
MAVNPRALYADEQIARFYIAVVPDGARYADIARAHVAHKLPAGDFRYYLRSQILHNQISPNRSISGPFLAVYTGNGLFTTVKFCASFARKINFIDKWAGSGL